MKIKKSNKKEIELLNTNEVMSDYEFHLKMIIENRTMDFDSNKETSESAA